MSLYAIDSYDRRNDHSWQNAYAITQHGQQPHYKKLGELKADYVTDTIIERFEV